MKNTILKDNEIKTNTISKEINKMSPHLNYLLFNLFFYISSMIFSKRTFTLFNTNFYWNWIDCANFYLILKMIISFILFCYLKIFKLLTDWKFKFKFNSVYYTFTVHTCQWYNYSINTFFNFIFRFSKIIQFKPFSRFNSLSAIKPCNKRESL